MEIQYHGFQEKIQYHLLLHKSQPSHSFESNGNGNNKFDRVLYENLVEMVPLVESLCHMDQKSKKLFPRRASMIHTKTHSKESKKGGEPKGRKVAQSIPTKKRRDVGDNNQSKDVSVDEFSIISSKTSAAQQDREELIVLQEQVENLHKKLLEKDELLRSARTSMHQMNLVHTRVDELKRQVAEKEMLIKSAHSQLSDAKVKLADKQAVLEKIQWEATASDERVQELQDNIESVKGEITAFKILFECLTRDNSTAYVDDYDPPSSHLDQLSSVDDMDEKEMQEMEEARKAYISANDAAKENQDDELLTIAANARIHLQSFISRARIPNFSFASNCL
ncbi:Microtubule binding protein 2c [Thalictrum thalictroides]|uniref:Microtubule binding protein 2c n=1 Tax=Thalictrum thalictroides TaxID=46969 RepID=A0A7J6X0B6_THATH|nr:Microtubule binding protein 2c [Thalictrum thalictroides]